MIFNSFSFFVFFLVVFVLYVSISHKLQNKLLLLASYFFYAAWDYRFCLLLLTTTLVDYAAGLLISSDNKYKKYVLFISIFINLSILGFFKYFGFFSDSFVALLGLLGIQVSPYIINIVLPVGISFYTFQSMSYTIDLYRGEVKPVTYFPDYALYVAFFPQLVAGPIERAKRLLPQISNPRNITVRGIEYGIYYVFTGLLLKVFVADNIARLIDPIFSSQTPQSGYMYLLAGYGFAFQIYGDFAGYSYVAKGLGSILGFDIMNNFNLPYFSQNPQEFWRRWHISLSTWLRDYLYIPLGGSLSTPIITARNLIITMLLGGLWHGAKITFLLWGGIHGLLLVMYHLLGYVKKVHVPQPASIPTSYFVKIVKICIFFHIIVFTWYFFRAESLEQLNMIFNSIIFNFNFTEDTQLIKKLSFYIIPLVAFQLLQYLKNDLLILFKFPVLLRSVSYVAIFYLIVIFGVNNAQDFLYFQF